MTRSKRMEPVVKVTANREQDAARLLGECQRVLDEREARLTELMAYQQEYAQRFQTQGAGMDMARLQDFRIFLGRLNESINQQRRLVEIARRDYELKKSNWFAMRQRSKAIDKVVGRYQSDEAKAQAKREQRDSDEHGLRSHRIVDDDG